MILTLCEKQLFTKLLELLRLLLNLYLSLEKETHNKIDFAPSLAQKNNTGWGGGKEVATLTITTLSVLRT